MRNICEIQKQSFADILQNRCSLKFLNIYRKTPVLESIFNKVAGLKASNFIKKRLKPFLVLYNHCSTQVSIFAFFSNDFIGKTIYNDFRSVPCTIQKTKETVARRIY